MMVLRRYLTWLSLFWVGLAPFAALRAGESDPVGGDPVGGDPILSEDLPAAQREWLEEVALLITEEEREYFLSIREEFRRKAFIKAFWKERDQYDDTPYTEIKVHWEERSRQARSKWGSLIDARAQTLLVHGEPYNICYHKTREVEVWIYDEGRGEETFLKNSDDFFPVLLYKPRRDDPYQRWTNRRFWIEPVIRRQLPDVPISQMCGDGDALAARQRIANAEHSDPTRRRPDTIETLDLPEPSKEWVASFRTRTTDLPAVAEIFEADLLLEFPGRHQQRTVAQGVLSFAPSQVSEFVGEEEAGRRPAYHQFLLVGEMVKGDELFETFRYRFELPAREDTEEPLALVFQRYLRPGAFRLILKLEDLYGHRFARIDREIEVPNVETVASDYKSPLAETELFRFLAEANAATARGERALRLLSPPGVVQTGMVRFQTIAVGGFDHVVFSLDEQPILTKRSEPYSVELDMGELPEMHRLRVKGFDAQGTLLATDELVLNPGGQRFRVRLTEPLRGQIYRRSLRAAVQVIVPEGKETEKVEIFLDEKRVATLFQPPFTQPIRLENDGLAYVRAVAYLTDGNSSEDLVFINAPGGNVEEIHVNFVELFATVHDRQGRLIQGLGVDDFKVLEDGVLQEARRFEWVDDLSLHTALVIDTSASMEDILDKVGEAALTFVDQTVEEKDRATLVTFNEQPTVAVRFTNDTDLLARHLKTLRASGGTSLYDSLVFALHYFHGVRGQRALLLLSDGKDESSGFDFDAALEFARRAGVQIYAIGLKDSGIDRRSRKVLHQLSSETGGRAFFLTSLDELDEIYASIQEDLRTQYLFAYQSSSDKDPSEFRRVEVMVERDGKKAEVRTMAGYYP